MCGREKTENDFKRHFTIDFPLLNIITRHFHIFARFVFNFLHVDEFSSF